MPKSSESIDEGIGCFLISCSLLICAIALRYLFTGQWL
jgi:hypothetical protein